MNMTLLQSLGISIQIAKLNSKFVYYYSSPLAKNISKSDISVFFSDVFVCMQAGIKQLSDSTYSVPIFKNGRDAQPVYVVVAVSQIVSINTPSGVFYAGAKTENGAYSVVRDRTLALKFSTVGVPNIVLPNNMHHYTLNSILLVEKVGNLF